MAEANKDFLDDLFNIPRNGSNIAEDDEADTEAIKSDTSVPFDDKAKQIAEEISKAANTVAPKEDTVVKSKDEKPSIDSAIKKIAQEKRGFDDLLEGLDTPELPKAEPKVDPKPVSPVITVNLDIADVGKASEQLEKAVKQSIAKAEVKLEEFRTAKPIAKPELLTPPPCGICGENPTKTVPPPTKLGNGKHLWKLTSPSPKYNYLYEEKASTLSNYLLRDGEIPFEDYYRELGEANVDTDVSTYDTEEVGRRITEVMKWRDRIKHIQLHTNSQWFLWETYMDLLPGVLARIEYERGKQEGIMYEHLNDMYGYYGSLKGLFKSCEMVSKHLDAAYNSLSRQIAIAQPLQEVERHNTGVSRPMTAQLSKFDSLTKNTSASGAGGRLKEADSAEPKQKKSVWERM